MIIPERSALGLMNIPRKSSAKTWLTAGGATQAWLFFFTNGCFAQHMSRRRPITAALRELPITKAKANGSGVKVKNRPMSGGDLRREVVDARTRISPVSRAGPTRTAKRTRADRLGLA